MHLHVNTGSHFHEPVAHEYFTFNSSDWGAPIISYQGNAGSCSLTPTGSPAFPSDEKSGKTLPKVSPMHGNTIVVISAILICVPGEHRSE